MQNRRWEDVLWRAVEKGERILLRVVIFSFVTLVVVQSLLSDDSMRLYLSWAERLEGEPLQVWSESASRVTDSESGIFAHMTIELKGFSALAKADLLINGKKIADFRQKRVTVKIYPSDVIEVDGSFYARPLEFEVVNLSANVETPNLHQHVQTNSSTALVGKVKFK